MKPQDLSWIKYLLFGSGRRLSLLGERLGFDALVYNPIVMLKYNEESSRNAPRVVPVIVEEFPQAASFLDVGSGTGALAAELQRCGRSVTACERSLVGRSIARCRGVRCYAFDLSRTPPTPVHNMFDVVTCFEVAEHLSPQMGDRLVDFICSRGAAVVFGAAHPGQGGTGHINEQPREYWVERFARWSFSYDSDQSERMRFAFDRRHAARWFGANVCVFRSNAG